jgi:hypothetical protein
MAFMKKLSREKVAEYVERTIAYMESDRGIRNWERNRDLLHYSRSMNDFAAVQTACRFIVYEHIAEVVAAIGPALNARNSRMAA